LENTISDSPSLFIVIAAHIFRTSKDTANVEVPKTRPSLFHGAPA
jgi:hypothetical protein